MARCHDAAVKGNLSAPHAARISGAHQFALVVNGVHLLETMKLDGLAQKQAYESAFMMQPLKIQRRRGLDGLADRGEVILLSLAPQGGR